MDSFNDNLDPSSFKEQKRISYEKRCINKFDAERKPFKKGHTYFKSHKWKNSFKSIDNFGLDIIYENSLEPQFGIEDICVVSSLPDVLTKYTGIKLNDTVVREIEGLAILFTNLSQQTTSLGALTSILSWVQGRTSSSLFSTIKDYLVHLLASEQSSETPNWLKCLKEARFNWRLCTNNSAFKQISKLMGCLVTLGMCKVSDLTFSIRGLKVFEPDLKKEHQTAHSLVDAIFDTAIYFIEGAYLCFTTRSLKPLFVGDRTAMQLDQEYAQITQWFDLVKNGNLEKFTSTTDQEFKKRLDALSTTLLSLSHTLHGLDKKLVMDKLQKVLIMQNDYTTFKIACGVRHAPWAIELFGESSNGKTMFGDQLIDALLSSQGMPVDKQYRCAYNAGDKFMSNWTSDKLVMIFDDISNDKAQFVERPPTRAIIDVINNQMYYAPKAELEAKGKCFVEPWIAVATTNKKNLDAGAYSNCPYSIQRRLTCLTVEAKPEFQRVEDGVLCGIDPTKVRDYYTKDGVYSPPMFDDIWFITIEQAVKPKNLREVAKYKPITWRGKEMVRVSMSECVQWAIEAFDQHRKDQEALLTGMRRRNGNLTLCGVDDCKQLSGNCPYHKNEVQSGVEDFRDVCVSICNKARDGVGTCTSTVNEMTDELKLKYNECSNFLAQWRWVDFVPKFFFENRYVVGLLMYICRDHITRKFRRNCVNLLVIHVLCCWLLSRVHFSVSFLICFVSFVMQFIALVRRTKENFIKELCNSDVSISHLIRSHKDKCVKLLCSFSISLGALYAFVKMFRKLGIGKQSTQGSLQPLTKEEIDARDKSDNIWSSVEKRQLPITDKSKRMVSEHLENVIAKNLLYGTIHGKEANGMLNGLMVSSNVMLMPHHYFKHFGAELRCTFRRNKPESSGGKFDTIISQESSVQIPGSDLCVCYTPNGGSFKNILEYFPIGDLSSTPFIMSWRKKSGEFLHARGITEPRMVTTISTFPGGFYKNLTMNTFDGLCGAVLVSDTNGSCIFGMHLGGTSGTPVGCYGSLNKTHIEDCIRSLQKKDGILITGEDGSFRESVMGVNVTTQSGLHAKSPLRFMPKESQVSYHGGCIGRSIVKSAVEVSLISPHVMDICGVPNIYRGPKLNPSWFGWQECLSNLANPAKPYPYGLLVKAINDYKSDLLPIFKSSLWNAICPLSYEQNICGVPGVKFLDPIKLDTSVGFPLGGPKRNFTIDLQPTREHPNLRVFDDVINDEIRYVEECYKRGERAYPVAKACVKDEILSKDKCRIFYGNPISLTFLIRKYYLPVLRVLQMNPLVSECAVGINSHGPEWETFQSHVLKFGENRLIGGDYGKYDQKLPSQLILAALRILVDFASCCNYTTEDLDVMRTMAGDIVYAYIAFNGDLISLNEGTHISGNSLTVIINGICGSLNMRCYYYSRGSGHVGNFREDVALMTYGDDNIGSVREGCDNFTIAGCSTFLDNYGQVYTMPDKESELSDFLPYDDFEFLKRKNVYHEKLGVHLGALLDKSIYKSLHCVLREKNCPLTREYACALNIDNAVREWFNHGEETYESNRARMIQVAESSNLRHLCLELDKNYDERCDIWRTTYC